MRAFFCFPLHNRYMKSKTTRFAAASVLAITIPLAPSIAHSATMSTQPGLNHARAFVQELDHGAQQTPATSDLTSPQRESVLHAVDSAIAASTEAISAFETARDASAYTAGQAREDLQDARTALEAASAEVTYVLDQLPSTGLAYELLFKIRLDLRLLTSRLA